MKILFYFLACLPFVAQAQSIVTFAGTGGSVDTGDGRDAKHAAFVAVNNIAFGSAKELYVSGEQKIRRIGSDGIVSTTLTTATPGQPIYLAADGAGNLYYNDSNRIYRRSATGTITLVMGNGSNTDAVCPASNRLLNSVDGMHADKAGNLYVASQCEVIKLTGDTSARVAGSYFCFTPPGNNVPATSVRLSLAGALVTDKLGNLYIAERQGYTIRKVDAATGIISTIAGTGTSGYNGDGGLATAAQVGVINGLAIDTGGSLYFSQDHVIRKVSNAGGITTIAGDIMAGFSGDGGPAVNAVLNAPGALAFDACGNLYIADRLNRRIREVLYQPSCANLAANNVSAADNDITLFPNPASGMLHIRSRAPIVQLAVTSIDGRDMLSLHTNSCTAQADVSGWPTGIYLVRINNTIVKRLVKQ